MSEALERFRILGAGLFSRLRPGEILLLNHYGEDSQFIRFNRSRIRSSGHLRQRSLRLDLTGAGRVAAADMPLSGEGEEDLARAAGLLQRLRDTLPHLPEDPFLNFATETDSTTCLGANRLPPAREAVEELIAAAAGQDLVGSLASGEMSFGFANSLGQLNWHSDFSFLADWSVHEGEETAVKQRYQGHAWEPGFVKGELAYAGETLALLKRPPRPLSPGRYRVFLAPEALLELLRVTGQDGFGLKSRRTRQTVLLRLVQGEAALSPKVSFTEDHLGGRAPRFTPMGFTKPEQVALVQEGRAGVPLADSRSAREYGEAVNCAVESPQSLGMAGGELHQDAVLEALDTGIFVSNLWYCNLSDRRHCRITGLTRFACLWVENGRAVAPVNVMRFDESLYHILGEGLVALTRERETLFDASTYGSRSAATATLPGALVDRFTLTL